ncbi:MAG TPA: helix-turn-helix transcriptional regulator [Acidimicrobiales bacterium]|jgi:DNA-binding CsgD family transcriptional regulator|nr:helix-turn-helix transcriptional regulator [Acidimicrobiales bacterium]
MTPGSASLRRAADRVATLCHRIDEERQLRIALLEEIRHGVAFNFYAWVLTDPESEVGSSPLAVVPALDDLPRLIRAKYLTTVNRWTALKRVATLVGATSGDRQASLMWRELLSSYGVTDVASLVFRDDHGCWGFLDLWRTAGAPPFSADDVAQLEALVDPITRGLRRALGKTFDHIPAPEDRGGPVVMILSPRLDVTAQTGAVENYLRTLLPPGDSRRPVPAGAYQVAAQLLAVEEGVDAHPPSSRVHLGDGVWMTFRAARVDTPGSKAEQDIAVTIELCSPAARRGLYGRCHGLSPREVELVERLAQGADTRTLARDLYLSEHTVQDHLKSIFAKTNTRNRRTLLSRAAGQ